MQDQHRQAGREYKNLNNSGNNILLCDSVYCYQVLEIISKVSQETTVNFRVLYQAVRSLMVKIDCQLDRVIQEIILQVCL